MKWQPIETAPRDGTRVLIYNGEDVLEARYCFGCWQDPVYSEWMGDVAGKPTHWMPLPEPPCTSS